MTTTSKQEYLKQARPRYQRAGREYKRQILDEFCAICGYERKWAIKLLNRDAAHPKPRPRGVTTVYGAALLPPLKAIWLAANQPCGKRLKPLLPLWLPHYTGAVADGELLLAASAATLDRLLRPLRVRHRKGRCGTKPGGLLKTQIPVRTDNTGIDRPGYLEADTVAHCGNSLAGDFVWTLTLTDIVSGWTSLRAVWNKGQIGVHDGIREIEQALPFPMLGFDSDNGGEFINWHLNSYLGAKQTCGRPYKKNDNAHVEQKNYTHARQLLGYERLERPEVVALINALFVSWEQLQNYFCPSMKLVEKIREGAKLKRKHDTATTPCDRLLDSPHLAADTKAALTAQRVKLNPFDLSRQVEQQLKAVWLANRGLPPASAPVGLRPPCAPAGGKL
jgi:hypothetical protein